MRKTLSIIIAIYEIPVIIIAVIMMGIAVLIKVNSITYTFIKMLRTIQYIGDKYIYLLLVISTFVWIYIFTYYG